MGRGTGLGLASAYGIIKNHGGIIDVYSKKGEGTTFNIYLPASEKEVTAEKGLYEGVLRGSETILLVDDEELILDVGMRLLEEMGYRIKTAGSGKEALHIQKENNIDIVILDMIMPGMSGSDTFDKMREFDPDIVILLSSGYSIDGNAQEILDRGCNGFIQKPGDTRHRGLIARRSRNQSSAASSRRPQLPRGTSHRTVLMGSTWLWGVRHLRSYDWGPLSG